MRCNIDDIWMNYEIIGEGKPILMIHGFYADHRLMKGCMEPIFKDLYGYKRIYIDLPGMGKTNGSEKITCSDHILNVVLKFIKKIIPEEKFLLAGESFGGYISRGIIYNMADRVDGLCLICPVIYAHMDKRNVDSHVILKRDEELLAHLSDDDSDMFDKSSVVQNRRIFERYRNDVLSGIKIRKKDFLRNIKKYGYEYSFDVDDLKHKFIKPSLILLGRQDSSVGYRDAISILENYSRATFAIIDKCGHNLQIEQERLFNELVKEWIMRTWEENK